MNPYEMDEYYDDDGYDDNWENAIDDCGLLPNNSGCLEAGTEYCSFFCPFHVIYEDEGSKS